MNENQPTSPDAPPPTPSEQPPKRSSFGAQAFIGFALVAIFVGIVFKTKNFAALTFGGALGLAAVVLCCIPGVRGYGVGMLLGVGLSALILIGMCFGALGNI